jgi:hypothetical protein
MDGRAGWAHASAAAWLRASAAQSARALMTMSFSLNWCAHCCRAASALLISARAAAVEAQAAALAALGWGFAARTFLDVAERGGVRLELQLQLPQLRRRHGARGAGKRARDSFGRPLLPPQRSSSQPLSCLYRRCAEDAARRRKAPRGGRACA